MHADKCRVPTRISALLSELQLLSWICPNNVDMFNDVTRVEEAFRVACV